LAHVQTKTPELLSDNDIVAGVRDTAAAADIAYRNEIVADHGKLQRLDVVGERKNSHNGWVVVFTGDRPCAFGGTWVGNRRWEWRPNGAKPLSPTKRRELEARIKAERDRYKAERQKKYDAAAKRANEIWAAAKPAPIDHPYLLRKGILPHGLRFSDWVKTWVDKDTGDVKSRTIKNALIVPIYVRDGKGGKKLVNLQAIFEKEEFGGRDKDNLFGGQKGGGYFTIGKPTVAEGLQTAVICEGFGTGASIFESTGTSATAGICTLVVGECGNIKAIAETFRAEFPELRIVICADDDCWKDPNKNPGVDHAREAEAAIKGKSTKGEVIVVVPKFVEVGEKPTDFNDLHKLEGAGVVRNQIMTAIRAKAAETAVATATTAKLVAAFDTDQAGAGIADAAPDSADPDRWKAKQQEVVDEFNMEYAVVNDGGSTIVFREVHDDTLDRSTIERFSFDDFQKMYQNKLVPIPKKGATEPDYIQAGKLWLNHAKRRQYLGGVTFDPTADPTGTAPADRYNLWAGYPKSPAPGDWSLMRDHLGLVICNGNERHLEYLLGWLARMFQKPTKAGEVAVVLRGKKGTGKGTIGNWLAKAWGQHGIQVSNPQHLIGNFNGHLRDCVFVFADEAFFAGDKTHEGVLKALITEPVLMIEAKYKNAVAAPNLTHILMASNSEWVVPASIDERRYFVLDVPDTKIGDLKYFADINGQMENGGLAAMIDYLLKYDISDFQHRSIPNSSALEKQKLHSMNSQEKWLSDVLDRGFVWKSRHGEQEFLRWQEFYSTDLLCGSYTQYCKENRQAYPIGRAQLGSFLSSIYPRERPRGQHPIFEIESTAKAPSSSYIQMKDRPHGYRLGALPVARATFLEKTKIPFSWDANAPDDDEAANADALTSAAAETAEDDERPF